MKSLNFALVFISFMALSFGQERATNTNLTELVSTEHAVKAVHVTHKPTIPVTDATTPAPTTTTAALTTTHPHTSTPAPTTTTPAPTTTTPAPTTTHPHTSTLAPTTTTQTPTSSPTPHTSTVSPITTPTPAPPKPKTWNWDVEENGTVCILAKMNINLDLKNAGEHRDVVFNVPKNATATGLCHREQSLTLSWDMEPKSSNSTNLLTFLFQKNSTTGNYYINKVEVKLFDKNEIFNATKQNLTMYETKENSSYSCSYSSPIEIKSPNNTLTISLSDIHLQAYLNASAATADFHHAFSCAPDSPDLVPILVGVALTLLIITVLIAYLYSRKRNQARGYLSM